jgi:hypothetical protein
VGSFASSGSFSAPSSSFSSSASSSSSTAFSYKSWEYYYNAAESEVPLYKVELAKSGRSKCAQKGSAKKCVDPLISKVEVRVGSIDTESGSYGRWNHLKCWRVASKVFSPFPSLSLKFISTCRFGTVCLIQTHATISTPLWRLSLK